jgi:Tfp pilus assembly protein PilF
MVNARSLAAPEMTRQIPIPLDELLQLATDFLDGGRLDDSERLLTHILLAAPDTAAALHLNAILNYRSNRHEVAASQLERAIELAPHSIIYWRNLCPIYERLGRYDDALRVGRRALDMDSSDLQTLHNLALVHYRRLALDESLACARQALALDPEAPGPHFQLAETLLLRGDFVQGWEQYEWRYQIAGAIPPLPPSNRPQWDGLPLPTQTLLLIADQGFGDTIQFGRYIPWVCDRCSDVVVAADPVMHPIIRKIRPAAKLVQQWNQCPSFFAYCPLSGLPRLHQSDLDTIPSTLSYLRADPAQTSIWRARLHNLIPSGLRRVGIVWAGRPAHNNDINRSASLADLAPIAAVDHIALISLQKGSPQNAIANYFHRAPLFNLGAAIETFDDTMAIIEALDLVVTVDTAVAHLAGAMGKPVWILLPYAPDWRWLLNRNDSPWYPTARLFRQSRPGDWTTVARDAAVALCELLG